MGSVFYSSKYVNARKGHTCVGCHRSIFTGHLYLSYALPSVGGTYPVHKSICLSCAVTQQHGKFLYDCSAVRDRVKELGVAGASAQPQSDLPL